MNFLGRQPEADLLADWASRTEAGHLTVIYGRRRIGKTRLIHEAFTDAEFLSFEGLEGQPTADQQRHFLSRLAELSGRPEFEMIKSAGWKEIFVLLSKYLQERYGDKPVVVLLDELQWMAGGRTKLVSSLKYAWDNHLKHQRVHLILCGSVCSFLVKKVIQSRSLYGRIHLEINLQPLTIPEMAGVFQPRRSVRDLVELYMAVGGVPQYLEMVRPADSVRANLEQLCFTKSGYLVDEFERLFVSHFGTNRNYRNILLLLGRKPHATRAELEAACSSTSGGRISNYLEELESAGFIRRYAPVDKPDSTRINRYRIADPYLLFYFRFIQPSLRKIQRSRTQPTLSKYVSDQELDTWRGLAFEYVCWQHADVLAERLGFGAVNYECGPWFTRGGPNPGAQIDLIFMRQDRVITLCECKFRDAPIGRGVIEEVERKRHALPNPKRQTIETALITASPPTDDLVRERYFNRILQVGDLFGK